MKASHCSPVFVVPLCLLEILLEIMFSERRALSICSSHYAISYYGIILGDFLIICNHLNLYPRWFGRILCLFLQVVD
jgi:hypothetical protein